LWRSLLASLAFAGTIFAMNDERQTYPDTVQNYTNAFLASFGVIVFLILFAIWAVWGLIVAGLLSALADRLITADFRRRSDG
jgi:hypothetical protein